MAYLVLARKYRPQTFVEVVGQEEIGRTLQRSIEQRRVGHAYLFAGPRGVGKTSMARIFAKALNCPEANPGDGAPSGNPCNRCPVCEDIARGSDVDVIEIDGASNRGIDEVRGIREGTKFLPARVRFKIYIIDEVHMLTGPAFNALLKTLEEPPPHVIFVFATTNPQSLPDTVRSRCQRYDFRPIGTAEIVKRLDQICTAEEAAAEPEALQLMAELAEGGMRDAQSLLDQMIAYGEGQVRRADVERMLGLPPVQVCLDIFSALARGEAGTALELTEAIFRDGGSAEDLADRLERIARDLLVLATVESSPRIHLLSGADAEALAPFSRDLFSRDALAYLVKLFLEARAAMRAPGPPRIALELALIRAAGLRDFMPLQEVIGAVKALADSAPAAGRDAEASRPDPAPAPRRPRASAEAPPPRPEAADRQDSGRSRGGSRPPRAAPSGSPPARPATRTIEDVEGRWTEVVQEVIGLKPSLGSLLARSRCARLAGDRLIVELAPRNRFGREQLSHPENLKTMRDIFLQVTGKSLTLEYVLADPNAASPDPNAHAARREPAGPEEGVKRVLDIFDGQELPPEGESR